RPHWWTDGCDAVRIAAESWAEGRPPERFSDIVLDVWELVGPKEAVSKQEFGTLLAPAVPEPLAPAIPEPLARAAMDEPEVPADPPARVTLDEPVHPPVEPVVEQDEPIPHLVSLAGKLVVEQLHFLAPKG